MTNPRTPEDSPISTEHAGGWTNEYRNYIPPQKPKTGHEMKIFGRSRTRQYDDIWDYQHSKTDEAKEDAALEAAIQRDLNARNITHPKPTD